MRDSVVVKMFDRIALGGNTLMSIGSVLLGWAFNLIGQHLFMYEMGGRCFGWLQPFRLLTTGERGGERHSVRVPGMVLLLTWL